MMTFRLLLLSSLAAVGLAFSPIPSAVLATATATTESCSSKKGGVTSLKMAADEVKEGDKIPSVVLKEGQADYEKPVDVNIAELIAGKKVAIFAVPGAFTPGKF